MPDVTRDREWIANVATVLKSTDASARIPPATEALDIEPGSRLTASLIGEVGTFWWVDTAALDGVRLERPVWFLAVADWTLLPPDYADILAPHGGGTTAELTAERLTDRRWRFGPPREKPYSTNYVFLNDGRIGGSENPNHQLWEIANGRLLMFSAERRLTFISETMRETDGLLHLAGLRLLRPQRVLYGVLAEMPPPAPAQRDAADPIKLVIWGLDDTFWQGRLSEGGITPMQAHIDIVKELSRRGIVSSVCCGNEVAAARRLLIDLGVWDYLVFARLDHAPKGQMVRDIIADAKLSAGSVLFIDDNRLNIIEALHHNPGLQVCEPDGIPGLLADRRLAGRPDPDLLCLARYKAMETTRAPEVPAPRL